MCLSVYVYMSVFMCAAYSECLSRLWLRELYRAIRSAMSHQLAANVFYAEVEGEGEDGEVCLELWVLSLLGDYSERRNLFGEWRVLVSSVRTLRLYTDRIKGGP